MAKAHRSQIVVAKLAAGKLIHPPNCKVRKIPLAKGGYAIVDVEDYAKVAVFPWFRHPKGHAQRCVVVGNGKRRTIYMHRFIVDAPPGLQVDHRNWNRLDNRRGNLRLVTNQQNQANCQKRNWRKTKSAYKGVGYKAKYRYHPWIARILVDGKRITLGLFATEEAAATAYNQAAVKFRGEFAALNVIGRKGKFINAG